MTWWGGHRPNRIMRGGNKYAINYMMGSIWRISKCLPTIGTGVLRYCHIQSTSRIWYLRLIPRLKTIRLKRKRAYTVDWNLNQVLIRKSSTSFCQKGAPAAGKITVDKCSTHQSRVQDHPIHDHHLEEEMVHQLQKVRWNNGQKPSSSKLLYHQKWQNKISPLACSMKNDRAFLQVVGKV